jgi:hypothetical protein
VIDTITGERDKRDGTRAGVVRRHQVRRGGTHAERVGVNGLRVGGHRETVQGDHDAGRAVWLT